MSISVNCSIDMVDVKHNAPRLMTMTSHHQDNPGGPWVEINLDNIIYRVKAHDLHKAIESCTGPEL